MGMNVLLLNAVKTELLIEGSGECGDMRENLNGNFDDCSISAVFPIVHSHTKATISGLPSWVSRSLQLV